MLELDLTQTALIIKGRDGPAEDVLRLDANEGRLVVSQPDVSGSGSVYIHPESRECTPAVHFADPEIHLRFDGEMKDPFQGWRFGLFVGDEKEEEVCDVFLGTKEGVRRNKRKISHIHFRIFYNFESGILVLANKSGLHGTTVLAPSIGDNGKKILVKEGRQSLNPSEVTVVKVADLEFLLSYPTLSGIQKLQHEANWKEFVQKYKDAVPGLGQLALSSSASTRPPSHRIGQRGGYTFFEELGRGNYGIVRRVTAYHSGAEYAAKEFFKTNAEQEARNLAEIAMLQSLSHPHIVKFVDLIADLAGLVLVMEYMPGNLKHQHREKRFSRTELKAIVRQVLDAVAYLHGEGRVHRDIKPENILLRTRDPPFAKISDFGLATKDGFLRTQCGTKKYAAPEIYKGLYDRSVDIWSIGATAFDVAEGLPDKPDGLSHENWATEVQRRVTEAYKERADPFLQLLKEMLDIERTARPSAETCLSDPRLDISPRDDQFDLNQGRDVGRDLVTAIPGPPTEIIRDVAPTERMSTSLTLKIVGINRNVDDNDEEAETRILYPTATSKQLCREQLQTPADAQPSKARERQPTNASYPPDDRFGVLINSNQEDPPHRQLRKRPRTGEISSDCREPQQLGEGSAQSAASLIIVEESIWNGEWFRECRIQSNIIKLRVSDNWISFESLARAARKTAAWISSTLRKIDRISKEPYGHGEDCGTLINFNIALPFITEFGLEKCRPLQSLINGCTKLDQPVQISITKADIRMIEVRNGMASLGCCSIAICPSRKLINASHLLKAAHIRRRQLRQKLSICNITKFYQVAGFFVVQGTYIDYDDSIALCEHLGLDKEMILQGIGAHTEPHTTEGDRRRRDPHTDEANDSETGIMDKFDQGRHSMFGVTGDQHSGSAEVYLPSSQSSSDIYARSSFWGQFAASPYRDA